MCRVNYFKAPKCDHRWMTIAKPCAKGAGFETCAAFKPGGQIQHGVVRPKTAPPGKCPQCDLDGDYDANEVREVTSHTYKWMWPGTQGENEYHSICNAM